ncbi:MAG TPA: hypothetical protein VHZ95_00365, partial [Polyangiales bacterium]|nr:hypothetical protein [Polyangiales bacterium]
LLPREYARLSRATHTLGAFSPSLLEIAGAGATAACLNAPFGFAAPIQLAWSDFVARFADAFTRAGIPYVYVESESEPTLFRELRVLVSPSYEFAEMTRLSRMLDFVRDGGTVLCGPTLPNLDETFRAHASPLDPSAFRLCDPTDADAVVERLANELGLAAPFAAYPASVETALHEDAGGPKLLFVLQPSAAPVDAEIQLPEPMAFTDVLTEDRYEGRTSALIPLDGYSCRMFTCERLPASTPPRSSRPPSARRSQPPC